MTETNIATSSPRASLVQKFAARFGVEPTKMLDTLKATAFKVKDGVVSNEQMMSLLVVADQYGLNPWTKEIYAFPDKKNGIVPVIGVDGWSRIINEHPQNNGIEFVQSENIVTPEGGKPCPEWIECVIHRKDRANPTRVREYLDEVYQPPRNGYSGPWQTHTKRFLRHKALIQGARIGFGFVGVYDQDEAERIIEGERLPDEPLAGKPVVKMPEAKRKEAPVEVAITRAQTEAVAKAAVDEFFVEVPPDAS